MKTPSDNSSPRFTVALDLGDSLHHACVLDERAAIIRQTTLDTTPAALSAFFAPYAPAHTRVVFEAGCHSPWIFRHLQAAGFAPLVANPRKLALISAHAFKHDRQDAETLARLGRSDPALLSPIVHRGLEAQADLRVLLTREQLVTARSALAHHLPTLADCERLLGPASARQAASSWQRQIRTGNPILHRSTPKGFTDECEWKLDRPSLPFPAKAAKEKAPEPTRQRRPTPPDHATLTPHA